MRTAALMRYAPSLSVAAALLAGCGGSQSSPPIVSSGAMMQHSLVESALSYKILQRFVSDGIFAGLPIAGLIDVDGTLYGTTYGRASTDGTVYSMSLTGATKMLYDFHGRNHDGSRPWAGLLDVNGTLYGTTYDGGTSDAGVVYSITTSGVEKVLYSFKGGSDGANPIAGLIDVNGTLYGTTYGGGGSAKGTIYSISTAGQETVLHAFTGGPGDGADPTGELIDVNGTLYGTTPHGGVGSTKCGGPSEGCGTVYTVTPKGDVKVLYRFHGGSDGRGPYAPLIESNGTLYGTTDAGGDTQCQTIGCGTIFSISTAGKERVLYRFRGGSDGASPRAGVIAVNGTLYGTTNAAGSSGCSDDLGCGTVYSANLSGAEKVLHVFQGGSDGENPTGTLIEVNGTLYGTTEFGGGNAPGCDDLGCGTAFALTP